MGISDRKRSVDVPVNINLDLNQEIKPNQFLVDNNFKGGDFVSRKKSGNILAGSKLNVDGQGIYNVKIITPDLFKKFPKQTPVSGGNPPTQTPSNTPTNTPTPSITPTNTITPTQTPSNTPTPTPTSPPFVCPDCVGDFIEIGTQTWKQCNADNVTYRDGTPIPQVTDPTAWSALTTGAWCYYDNNPANGPIYGKIYNWYAVAGIYDGASLSNPLLRKQFAPSGYHVPSITEFTTLINYLGGFDIAGGTMKTTGTVEGNNGCWLDPNGDATNSSGFEAQPGGSINSITSIFEFINFVGIWWSSTENIIFPNNADYMYITSIDGSIVIPNPSDYSNGFSVRLIKD